MGWRGRPWLGGLHTLRGAAQLLAALPCSPAAHCPAALANPLRTYTLHTCTMHAGSGSLLLPLAVLQWDKPEGWVD